nr:ATP-binding cassette domain-containing protein [Jiella pelagia]
MTAENHALRLEAVGKEYRQGENRLTILKDAEITLAPGEMVALVAPSGAGKSTLLHIAGLLDRPDSGEVHVGGVACGTLGDEARTAMRRHAIGFVYQFHHLLPEFSALENVMLPQMIGGLARKDAAVRAQELLDYMRIGARSQHRPAEALRRRAAARRHRPRSGQLAARSPRR